jgi:acyl-CoA synthetase (NDP forming)
VRPLPPTPGAGAGAPRDEPASPPGSSLICHALEEGRLALDEREAKALLAAYELPTPMGKVVHSAQAAARAVQALGRPAVLKGLGPDIQHKSDRGLVALDVREADEARVAYHRIVDLGAGRVRGVLVEELVPHERELLVGMRRDEQFGPVVAFGLGGIFTEALGDVAFALAPIDDEDTLELIGQVHAQRLLGAVRGLPRIDGAELTRIVRAVGQIALDHPQIIEIDVNPLLVSRTSLVAADALVVLEEGEARPREGSGTAAGAPRDRLNLDKVFSPASVAVIGASEDTSKWGGSLMSNLIESGFDGVIYPVNPRGGTIFGLPAHARLSDLPATPDLAIVALGGEHATSMVHECGHMGVPAALVIAAGFGEAGAKGAELESELAEAARTAGITLIGPNCMGVLATSSHLNAVGFVTLRPEDGPLSVISQSGNIGTQLLMTAERRGVGVEKFVSSGNQATTDANDLLEYLAGDEKTGVVVMYLEGVGDGRRFYDIARATTARKPIVVIRGGTSAPGRRAASSHTGAMAGSNEVFAAAARQAGVLTSVDPEEALGIAGCLAYLPLPRGRRTAVVTLGGGWGVMTADALAANGMQLADLPAEVLAAVDELLPSYWSHGNPIDLVASVAGGVPERIIELVAGCEAVDAIVTLALIGSPSSGRMGSESASGGGRGGDARAAPAAPTTTPFAELNEREEALIRHIAEVMERTGKPVISVPLTPVRRSVFAGLGRFAPVLLPSPPAAVRALASMAWYAERRAREAVTRQRAVSSGPRTAKD